MTQTLGKHPGLYVPQHDLRRGKSHCLKCGGRTNERNSKRRAMHQSCGGKQRKAGGL